MPKIFIICSRIGYDDYCGLALAEDGNILAQHLSSSRGYSRYDMITSGCKNRKYKEHYPDGYEIVDHIDFDFDLGDNPEASPSEGYTQAFKKNKELEARSMN